MTSPDLIRESVHANQRYLEFLVPVFSFGITGIGILFWQQGLDLNYQVFSLGCIISSCILAYLAWIRPHRDIVALSTPIYAFIFFFVPSDGVSWIVLQLFYAASLTALLIRLKFRFGMSAPAPGHAGYDGPLDQYCRAVIAALPPVSPVTAGDAAAVFIRFAQGDYDGAARAALCGDPEQEEPEGNGVLTRAFSIVAEQAAHTKTGGPVPPKFTRFLPEDAPFLFHPDDPGRDAEQEYSAALDNGLLLLYAAGFGCRDDARILALNQLRPFAGKLSGER
jgi:hypothetical protein